MLRLASDPVSWAETLAPFLPVIGIVVSGLIIGGFAVWNRRRGAVETKAPSVAEAWKQAAAANGELDIERKLRRWFESAFWSVVAAFTSYVDRVKAGGSRELRAHERRALEQTPPSIEKETAP